MRFGILEESPDTWVVYWKGEMVARVRGQVAAEGDFAYRVNSASPQDMALFRSETITAQEDEQVRVLCERFGYGAVMDAASRLWTQKDPMGAFFVGGCVGHKWPHADT